MFEENLKESIKRISNLIGNVVPFFLEKYSPTLIFLENEIYFSSVEGIHDKSPETLASCFMKRCES